LDAGTGRFFLRSAEQKLSRLDLAGEMVPSIDRFFYAFVRKEAVNKEPRASSTARNSSVTAARLLELLPRHPMVTLPAIVRLLNTSKPTAAKAVSVLERLRILKETTGRRRDRTYGYSAYLERLRAGRPARALERREPACQPLGGQGWQALDSRHDAA